MMGGRRFGGALGGEQVGGTVGGEGGGDDRHQRGRDAPAWDAAAVVAAGAAARHRRRDPPRTRDDSVLPGVFSMFGGLAQNVKNGSVRSQSREKSAWSPRAAARRGRASHQGGRGARRAHDPGPPPRSFPATVRSRSYPNPRALPSRPCARASAVPFPPACCSLPPAACRPLRGRSSRARRARRCQRRNGCRQWRWGTRPAVRARVTTVRAAAAAATATSPRAPLSRRGTS